MRFARWVVVMGLVAVAIGLVATARWTLQAQNREPKAPSPMPAGDGGRVAGRISVQDAMIRPLDLPFAEETTLEEVRAYLGQALGAQVVLDRTALDRLELTPEDTVRLDLKGVRLKVGLKLLLDQVGLAYRVVAEDNLLILTEPESSEDHGERVLAEIKSLHREMHDLQDALDDLRDAVEEELGLEPERSRNHSTLVRRGRARPSRRADRPGLRRGAPGARG